MAAIYNVIGPMIYMGGPGMTFVISGRGREIANVYGGYASNDENKHVALLMANALNDAACCEERAICERNPLWPNVDKPHTC